MQEGLKRQGRSERVDMLSEQGHMMEFLQRINLKYMTSADLRIGFLIKSLKNSQKLLVIGCLTLNSKRVKVLIHQMGSQLVESVVKSTMLIALRGWIISLVVKRVAQDDRLSKIEDSTQG